MPIVAESYGLCDPLGVGKMLSSEFHDRSHIVGCDLYPIPTKLPERGNDGGT
jgi:hypothetical protein